MTPDGSHEARERFCALTSFENAMAVTTQIVRLRETDVHDQWLGARRLADTQFLVIALWRLRMAACMCEELRPGSTEGAIATFDAALPGLKDLRNVLMHYDSYVMGGKTRRTRAADTAGLVSLADVRAQLSSPDGFAWLGHEYCFDDVEQASKTLYRAIAEVVGQPT